AEQPLRQRSSFQSNSLEVVGGVLQHRQQRYRLARHLHFSNDLARLIHNADAGRLDRYVQSSKMVHAALLLLMLEAAQRGPRFTISLKRSTQNLQLSTSWPADYPILWPLATAGHVAITVANGGRTDIGQSAQNVVPDPKRTLATSNDALRKAYSITSSARTSSDAGTSRPSA